MAIPKIKGDCHTISPQTMRSATAAGGSKREAVCELIRNDILLHYSALGATATALSTMTFTALRVFRLAVISSTGTMLLTLSSSS